MNAGSDIEGSKDKGSKSKTFNGKKPVQEVVLYGFHTNLSYQPKTLERYSSHYTKGKATLAYKRIGTVKSRKSNYSVKSKVSEVLNSEP